MTPVIKGLFRCRKVRMQDFRRRWQWPIAMALLAWPAAALRTGAIHASVPVETAFMGLAIVSAAFLLTWCAEAAERDIPRTLALAGSRGSTSAAAENVQASLRSPRGCAY